MKKIILGLVAATAVAAPLAARLLGQRGYPVRFDLHAVRDAKQVTHTEYQWAALVAKPTLHWDYKWTASTKNPSTDILHIWVKSLDLTKKGLPQITRTVVDVDGTRTR